MSSDEHFSQGTAMRIAMNKTFDEIAAGDAVWREGDVRAGTGENQVAVVDAVARNPAIMFPETAE